MPRKIKELIRDLELAGFTDRGGKGSHHNFKHPYGAKITISGKFSEDPQHYQEKALKKALREAEK